jgi:DNA-binding winged helix-turn-helix (wHTH) protein
MATSSGSRFGVSGGSGLGPLGLRTGLRTIVRFGVYTADLSARRLYKHGIKIRLQEQPFRVLALLLENAGEVVSREELHAQLWPNDTFVAFDEGLNAAVNRLRRALGDSADNPKFIETIPKQGYRFIGALIQANTAEEVADRGQLAESEVAQDSLATPGLRRQWIRLAAVAAVAMIVGGGTLFGYRALRRNAEQNNRAEAIRECQQGRDLWKKRNAESLTKAIEHYNKAVAIDPSYAPSYSGLADAYIVLPFLSTITPEEAYPKARAAAGKAVVAGPELAETHTSLADVKLYVDWDFAGAEREFRRALELNPNYPTAHQWYAEYLSLTARHEEAIQEILRAEQLEPLSVIMYHQAGQIYQNARQYDHAMHQYEKALEIDPTFFPACARLTDAFRHKGMYRESLETELEFYKRHAISFYSPGADQTSRIETLSRGFSTAGEKGYWRARLDMENAWIQGNGEGWTDTNGGAEYALAVAYGQNGDFDHALVWLNKLYERRGADLLGLKVDPDVDPLRSDPRFQELVKRIGLP